METVFRVGDKVFDIRYGWGFVESIDLTGTVYLPIGINFSDVIESYRLDGRTLEFDDVPLLSFTEYTLNGFSLERPIELPEVGEEIMVSDCFGDPDGEWFLRTFKSYKPTLEYPVETNSGEFRTFKRLR